MGTGGGSGTRQKKDRKKTKSGVKTPLAGF
jgi:hypothetical protein